MWIKCQDGTLVNTNNLVSIGIRNHDNCVVGAETGLDDGAWPICKCLTRAEAERLRDDVYAAIEAKKIAYSVLAEDQ